MWMIHRSFDKFVKFTRDSDAIYFGDLPFEDRYYEVGNLIVAPGSYWQECSSWKNVSQFKTLSSDGV